MGNRVSSPSKVFAGVDLGGTKIAAVLGTPKGQILASDTIETLPANGPRDAFERITELLNRLTCECGSKPVSIGIGIPGLVDSEHGIIEFLPNLPADWRGFAAAEFLHNRTGLEAFLLNDARLAALGEHQFGTVSPRNNLLVVTIGTGIGGGLILDGRLRLGLCGGAGEIGHQTILPDGEACSCGSRGCLETLVNARTLTAEGISLARTGQAPHLAKLVQNNWSAITPKEMAIATLQGDIAVAAAIETAARYLGLGIANAITLTAVDHVVLTGGVAALGELLLQPVREVVRERVRMFPAAEHVRISCSTLGPQAGALGALALAFQKSSTHKSVSDERVHNA
jgi:glucokinase